MPNVYIIFAVTQDYPQDCIVFASLDKEKCIEELKTLTKKVDQYKMIKLEVDKFLSNYPRSPIKYTFEQWHYHIYNTIPPRRRSRTLLNQYSAYCQAVYTEIKEKEEQRERDLYTALCNKLGTALYNDYHTNEIKSNIEFYMETVPLDLSINDFNF